MVTTMSAQEDKDLTAPRASQGRERARAQLHELRSRWGQIRVTEGTEEEPRVIERLTRFGNLEIWKWVNGRGTKAWFECANGGN